MYDEDQVTSPGLPPNEPTLVGPRAFNKDHTMIGLGGAGYALAQMAAAQEPLHWEDDAPTGILPLAPPAQAVASPAMHASELLTDDEAEIALADRLAAEPNLPKVQLETRADAAPDQEGRGDVTRKMPRILVARQVGPARRAASTPLPVVSCAPDGRPSGRPSDADLADLDVMPRRRSWFGGVAVAAALAITVGLFALTPSLAGLDESSPASPNDSRRVGQTQTLTQGVRLSSTQVGVRISVDGQDHGLLPAKVQLAPGMHTLRLEGDDGLVPVEREIQVAEGTMLDLGTVDLPAAGRAVTIAGVPSGARVLLVELANPTKPRKIDGPFPQTVQLPADGEYKLVTTLAGHHHFVRSLAWADGETSLSVEVELLARRGGSASDAPSDVDTASSTAEEEEIDDPYADDEPPLEDGAGPTNAPPDSPVIDA